MTRIWSYLPSGAPQPRLFSSKESCYQTVALRIKDHLGEVNHPDTRQKLGKLLQREAYEDLLLEWNGWARYACMYHVIDVVSFVLE